MKSAGKLYTSTFTYITVFLESRQPRVLGVEGLISGGVNKKR